MKYIILILCFSTSCFAQKIYIESAEFDLDTFHMHVGNNTWLETQSIYHDYNGLYTYQRDIKEYQKKWKCPYCYMMWPQGQPCQNSDCPSRYK